MAEPRTFRKRPVEIQAVQFDGANAAEISTFTRGSFRLLAAPHPGSPDVIAEVWDKLHHTWVGVKAGDWILRGVQGEFYPVDSQVMEQTYEAVGNE